MTQYEQGLADALKAIDGLMSEYLGFGIQYALLAQAKARISALIPVRAGTDVMPEIICVTHGRQPSPDGMCPKCDTIGCGATPR